MARETATQRRAREEAERASAGRDEAAKAEREATQRVVFRREQVLVIPVDGNDPDDIAARVDAAAKALGPGKGPKPVEAWIEVDRKEGSQEQAIRAHAGTPGTPDAKPGAYRTTPARSWKGGKRYTKPAQIKIEAEELTD